MHSKLLVLLAIACSCQALAQNPALVRCAHVVEPSARLACYDAVQPPVGVASAAKPLATQSTLVAPPAPAAAERAAFFGLAAKPRDSEPQTVESAVGSDFDGWGPNERISLQNGQVWMVVDGSSGTLRKGAAKVTLRRGALGSFFIDFEGLNKSPRVQRVQ